jgi:hypothetical protein
MLLPHPFVELAPICMIGISTAPKFETERASIVYAGWFQGVGVRTKGYSRKATVSIDTSSWFQSPIVQPMSIRLIGSVVGSRWRSH